MSEYDLAVIGSGPGGYVAAIRAAQLGLKTVVIESKEVGGTCLNRGCVPTKTLLHSAQAYYETKNLDALGVTVNEVSFDMEKIHERKEKVSAGLRSGIEQLFKANKITLINGIATITGNNTIAVNGENTTQITADSIIIATGGKPVPLPIKGIDLPNVFCSDRLLANSNKNFKRLTIIGGGVIGVEFASIYNALGCEVTIIEGTDRILPRMDKEISQNLAMILKKRGVIIHNSATVEEIVQNDTLTCIITAKGERCDVKTDAVLAAVGRKPNIDDLFGKDVNIQTNNGFIVVDDNFRTDISNIYAVGDVIGGALAHQAAAQGTIAA
ncbi:MAG: NAD(P)/FAD-dependent oxidoreductase, partial [Oscillospiraceae bacterium]